jgi:hypothetical protein
LPKTGSSNVFAANKKCPDFVLQSTLAGVQAQRAEAAELAAMFAWLDLMVGILNGVAVGFAEVHGKTLRSSVPFARLWENDHESSIREAFAASPHLDAFTISLVTGVGPFLLSSRISDATLCLMSHSSCSVALRAAASKDD